MIMYSSGQYRTFLKLIIVLVVLLQTSVTLANNINWDTPDLESRPMTTSPTEVDVALDISAISEIVEPDEKFRLFATFDIGWKDPRLKFTPQEKSKHLSFEEEKADLILQKIWWPDLSFKNSVSKPIFKNKILLIKPDGSIRLHMVIDIVLRYQADLLHLPFDTQYLPIIIEAFGHNNNEVKLHNNTKHSGFRSDAPPVHWQISGMKQQSLTEAIRHQDDFLSQVKFELIIKRDGRYFFWRIILPMMLIVIISWGTFWMSSNLGDRVSSTIVVILTIMAFNITVNNTLPRISYLTFIDVIFISSLIFAFLTVLIAMLVHHLTDINKTATAQYVDTVCRIGFPTMTIFTWFISYLFYFIL